MTPDFEGKSDPNVPPHPSQGPVGPGNLPPALVDRPSENPDVPQGSGPEVPGSSLPAWQRPAPAGEVRKSWAEQGSDLK